MKKIIEYRTIAFHSDTHPDIATKKIKDAMDEGLQPFGSPALATDNHGVIYGMQAFVKYEEATESGYTKNSTELYRLMHEVVKAWMLEGPAPLYHKRAKESLLIKWPTLAKAVEELSKGVIKFRQEM